MLYKGVTFGHAFSFMLIDKKPLCRMI